MFYKTLTPINQISFLAHSTIKNGKSEKLNTPTNLTENLFLHGKNGGGKTFATLQFAKAWLKETNCDPEIQTQMVKFLDFRDFAILVRDKYSDKTDTKEIASSRFDDLKQFPLLIIDDFGTNSPSNSVFKHFCEVFEVRYQNGLQTLITSNLNKQEIRSVVGEATYSRMTSYFRFAEVVNQDLRQLKIKLELDEIEKPKLPEIQITVKTNDQKEINKKAFIEGLRLSGPKDPVRIKYWVTKFENLF